MPLCNPLSTCTTVNWAETIPGRDLIQRAWEKCAVGEFNLGAECLTSKKTKAAYRQYLAKNPDFRQEIEDKIGKVLEIDDETVAAAIQAEAEAIALLPDDHDLVAGPEDDTEVPLQHIIKDAVDLDIVAADLPATSSFCVSSSTVTAGIDG
ncbi:hypothetical protein C8R44DRAFT_894110 [Mycena epipterygia]|nr:hypothetical protein C8R44DRAFT_894110 [Mycena epipterygia]